ncbi:uncharacterized protein BXZ73DRAFT_59605, partial [Epithele typhae]|uniref:uncharacterized protein n=1 Tax=Epithele typhae TaxID=378194 RepID=UPI002008AE25
MQGYGPLPGSRATCGHRLEFRCLGCSGRPTYCSSCLRNTHAIDPFHRIEAWVESMSCYRPAWLQEVGLQIHCGHGGEACP